MRPTQSAPGELRARVEVGRRLLDVQAALASKVEELRQALDHIKTLRGLSNRVIELGGESGHDTYPHLYPGSYVEYVRRTGHEAPGVHA